MKTKEKGKKKESHAQCKNNISVENRKKMV